jgi:hypothetical protein
MNWWSVFTWCEAIGGKLADFSSLCPNIQINPNNVAGACPNIKGVASSSGGWTSTGWGTTAVLIVNPSSDGIATLGRNVNVQGNGGYGYIYALCEE